MTTKQQQMRINSSITSIELKHTDLDFDYYALAEIYNACVKNWENAANGLQHGEDREKVFRCVDSRNQAARAKQHIIKAQSELRKAVAALKMIEDIK